MCGIVGIFSEDKSSFIDKANLLIGHRGPDDEGVFRDGPIALGHQRLSILDLSENGHQPMVSQNDRYVLTFNGEIYNHKELRDKILFQGYKSDSDTETILYGYAQYGEAFFEKMNGIFALSIYDKLEKKLLICRDRFGVKPLYYYWNNGELFFASEMKSFLPIPGWNKEIDFSALHNYIQFLWSPGEQTPFLHVKKLLPGTTMSLDIETKILHKKQYYRVPFDGTVTNDSEDSLIEQLDFKLSEAVERQLLSDVPVGYFLSGGLDSSLIVALAQKFSSTKLNCFTIDSNVSSASEGFTEDLKYARMVSSHLDVNLEVIPSKVDILNDFDKMIYHLEEPQGDAAPLNVLMISERAREMGHHVLLGGTAGDDLFSGYRRHQALEYEKYLKHIPVGLGNLISSLVKRSPLPTAPKRRIAKLLKGVGKSSSDRLVGYYEWMAIENIKNLFADDVRSSCESYYPANILKASLSEIPLETSDLNKLLYLDIKHFLTDHNLNYTDKLSMAAGVEVRVPFLDNDLFDFAAGLPRDMKLRNGTTKYLLKKVAEKYLPKEVIYRPKTGFGTPVREWITGDLDELLEEYLSEASIEKRGIFDHKAVWDLIKKNKQGQIDASYSIWVLLAIESWMRQFSD